MNHLYKTNYLSRNFFIGLSLLFSSCLVHASPVNVTNGTLTTFDAATGDLTFDWDLGSEYAITGTDVIVNSNNILVPGAGFLGTFYQFIIPNFYDGLPVKKIDISMQGANSGASGLSLPSVLSIVGADSDFDNGGPALPVIGSFVSGTSSPTLVTEYWEMFPNPDFETIDIYVPAQFELQSISIATQSTVVPIPAAIWLFGSGLLGLVGFARRRQV